MGFLSLLAVGGGDGVDGREGVERARVADVREQRRGGLDERGAAVADRLAEAATEFLHRLVAKQYWGYCTDGECLGIRPAIGYPSLPDQGLIFQVERLMPLAPTGIQLTENGAMSPASSTCGFIMSHPQSRYFMVGAIGDDQRRDYASRRGMSIEDTGKWLR